MGKDRQYAYRSQRRKRPTTLSSPSLGASVKNVLFSMFTCHFYCLVTEDPRGGAAPPSLWGAVPVSFIWLSAKGFYSQVLFCSQKWLHKRAPSNFTYIFPVYQNCIYLFLWLRHTCTISIPVICTEQIQFRSNKLASIPSCMWPKELVPQSVHLQWWNCIDENKAAQLFLKAHFKLLGL